MGTASCPSVPINNGTNGTTTFNFEIYIRDSHTRNSTEDIVTITMAPPGTGFVTGGGYLTMTSSIGEVPGAAGTHTKLGFNVKCNKSKTVGSGDRCSAVPDGIHVYQVKSNKINSLGVTDAGSYPAYATVIAGASIKDLTNPLNICSVRGNATLQLNLTHNSRGSQTDMIGVSFLDGSNNLWYAGSWNGGQIVQQQNMSGNVTIH